MLVSCEVRWFFAEQQRAIVDWFARKNLKFREDKKFSRTDFYLQSQDQNGLGIKLREGNIEIKELLNSNNHSDFITFGNVESWCKWSFNVAQEDNLAHEIITEKKNNWIEVKKDRLGFKYSFDNNSKIEEIPIEDKSISEACQIEYTRLEITNVEYFTFNLESFSKTGKQKENLQKAAELAFHALNTFDMAEARALPPRPSLSLENSMSYPDFLKSLDKVKRERVLKSV